MVLTGRRTCELLNGKSSFDADGDHAVWFHGQAKTRSASRTGFRIPVLAPSDWILHAFAALRARQCIQSPMDNRATSRRYQSLLSRAIHRDALLSHCGCVHGLRGVYACMCVQLFRWVGHPSPAFVTMHILGHCGLHESLVYTPFHLGDDFYEEPRLGSFALSTTPEECTTTADERSLGSEVVYCVSDTFPSVACAYECSETDATSSTASSAPVV